jgi:hypothetical protein
MNIVYFYHIYADGMWEEPVTEHFKALIDSDLYSNLKQFNVGLVGSLENRLKIKNFINNYNFKVNICNESDSGWEQETLDSLHDFCKNDKEKNYIVYTHSKTATNNSDLHVRWRKTMVYYNIIKWRECFLLLEDKVSAVGCYYLKMTEKLSDEMDGFFGGNFWWTHSQYLKDFPEVTRTSRYDAEGWIGFLKSKVENNNEIFRIHDWTPCHPGEENGRIVEW